MNFRRVFLTNLQLIDSAQRICSKDPKFSEYNEETKANIVINTIYEYSSLLGENIYLLIDANRFLKLSNIEKSTSDFLKSIRSINHHAFFDKDSIQKQNMEHNKEEIENLRTLISSVISEYSKVLSSVSKYIKICITLLTKLKKPEFANELAQVTTALKKRFDELNNFQLEAEKIFHNLLEKSAIVEKQLFNIYQEEEKVLFKERISGFETELKKVFKEQDEYINKINSFTMKHPDNFLEIIEMVNKNATYMMFINLLQNLVSACKKSGFFEAELKILIEYNKTLLSNFEKLHTSLVRMFTKHFESLNTFKQKVILPLKDKIDAQETEMIIVFAESVY